MFLYELCEIFKNIFFTEHLWATASTYRHVFTFVWHCFSFFVCWPIKNNLSSCHCRPHATKFKLDEKGVRMVKAHPWEKKWSAKLEVGALVKVSLSWNITEYRGLKNLYSKTFVIYDILRQKKKILFYALN